MNRKKFLSIALFYLTAILVRYYTQDPSINSPFWNIIVQGLGPTIGVLVTMFIFRVKFSPMTLTGNYKQPLFPILVYWGFPIILISISTLLTQGTFNITTILACFIYGLLEEVGWRGFLQQQLKGLPNYLNIILVGILWFIWHLNYDISSANLIFLVILILSSWGIGVVAKQTNSLLAVAAFHSLYNIKSEHNLIIIAILFVSWIALLFISARRRKKKKQE